MEQRCGMERARVARRFAGLLFAAVSACSPSPAASGASDGAADVRDAVVDADEVRAASPDATGDASDAAVDGTVVAVDRWSAVETSLQRAGYATREGAWGAVDLSRCCEGDGSCYANNPASPYFSLTLPPADTQTAANPVLFPDAQGRSSAFRLGRDEAVVLFTDLPPAAAYSAFTPYVYDRADGASRSVVFASLHGGLNRTRYRDREGTSAVLVMATSAAAEGAAMRALTEAGVDASTVLRVPWVFVGSTTAPPRFGLDADADTFALLGRLAVPRDASEAMRYLSRRFRAMRATGSSTGSAPAPPETATQRARPEDASLNVSLDRLALAIRAAHARDTLVPVGVIDGTPTPARCLEQRSNCQGDNRDTDYPTSRPFVAPGAAESVVVFGVNHAATGHSTYSGVGLYSVAHAAGVTSVTSDRFAGTARAYVPADPNVDRLFVWTFARRCNGAAACTEVSTAACPAGLPDGAASLLMMRDYVDPETGTAPRYDDLVPYRIFMVRP